MTAKKTTKKAPSPRPAKPAKKAAAKPAVPKRSVVPKPRKTPRVRTIHRSAGNGKIVTKAAAKASPGTTVREKIRPVIFTGWVVESEPGVYLNGHVYIREQEALHDAKSWVDAVVKPVDVIAR